MRESSQLEELAARLARVLPPGLRGLRSELEDNFRAVLRANLDRLELVSRERFDVQAELLARTQARLAELERRLAALESPKSSSSRKAAKDAKEVE
jgi:ubiquinone biosynthesis accessory factor UbiK